MNATTTTLAGQQCLRALQRANEVRLARADLKRRVAAGTVNAAEVILSPSSEIEGMTVVDILMSQRRWGHSRCHTLLTALPLPQTKTVGSMTDRQRRALATMLAAPEPVTPTAPVVSAATSPPVPAHCELAYLGTGPGHPAFVAPVGGRSERQRR